MHTRTSYSPLYKQFTESRHTLPATHHLIVRVPRVVNIWDSARVVAEGDGHLGGTVLIVVRLPPIIVSGTNGDGVDVGRVAIRRAGVVVPTTIPSRPHVDRAFPLTTLIHTGYTGMTTSYTERNLQAQIVVPMTHA